MWIIAILLGRVPELLEYLTNSLTNSTSILKTANEPHGIDPLATDGIVPSAAASGAIRIKNVHFRYPSRPLVPVLNGIDLSLKTGERMALVGASGSGKTTILQLIHRFYDPQQGKS